MQGEAEGRATPVARPSSIKSTRSSRLPTVGLGLETPDEEPECQRHFKESTGNREQDADVDPEDFSYAPRHEDRVANQAQHRQKSGDQPGPEQQRAQEYAPETQRDHADLVGHGVRLDRE